MSESSLRPAQITRVLPDSIAAEVGFDVGDRLVSINGQPLRDLIDYRFLCADEFLDLYWMPRARNTRSRLKKTTTKTWG
jgi:NifB/MoaA-like Fe-S oxidoreductase